MARIKTVCVVRLGAIGDQIIITPVLCLLKEQGYHVTMNTTEGGYKILKHNPYIDEFLMHDSSMPADETITKHWDELAKNYDRFINFSESIEGTLSKIPGEEGFDLGMKERREECDKNFYDHTLEWAGMEERGLNGELHFSQLEHKLCKDLRKKYRKSFLILWVLSGSSPHKAYPYGEQIAEAILDETKDVVIMMIGDGYCGLIELRHKRAKNYCGVWPIRKALCMTQYADLVIGPDTGAMHAAGCYDVPKILLLSSMTEENLSKYWKNCTNLSADVRCQPCFRLHYGMDYCLKEDGLPLCMAKLNPEEVIGAIQNEYLKWKLKRRRKHGSTSSANTHNARC